jgi:hypothetical protein
VPDDEDYADLARLLASPESWSEQDAVLVRSLLRSQVQAVESAHPKDVRRRADMQAVADDLRAAVVAYERRSG